LRRHRSRNATHAESDYLQKALRLSFTAAGCTAMTADTAADAIDALRRKAIEAIVQGSVLILPRGAYWYVPERTAGGH